MVFCSELRVFQRNTLSLGKPIHEKVALISSRLKFLTKFEVGSDKPFRLKMSKIKLAFWSPPPTFLDKFGFKHSKCQGFQGGVQHFCPGPVAGVLQGSQQQAGDEASSELYSSLCRFCREACSSWQGRLVMWCPAGRQGCSAGRRLKRMDILDFVEIMILRYNH